MAFDRAAKDVNRLRREWQQTAVGEGGFVYGSGLSFDTDLGEVSVNIVTTNGGLEFNAGELQLDIASGAPLTLTGGLSLVVDDSLVIAAGTLGVDWNQRKWEITPVATANVTAAVGQVVRCDPSGGSFTVTLPSAVGAGGEEIIIKEVTGDTTGVTVAPDGSEEVDGDSSRNLNTAYEVLHIVSDGANWMEV